MQVHEAGIDAHNVLAILVIARMVRITPRPVNREPPPTARHAQELGRGGLPPPRGVTQRGYRTARTCAQMAIIPRNNTSDANAAGSFNTDLTMTSLVEQNENIVPYLFAIVKRDVMSAFSGNDDWTELVRRFGVRRCLRCGQSCGFLRSSSAA